MNELKARLANLHTETERAEAIKQFINERKQLLREQLSGLNLDRQLEKIHRSTEQYKHLVNDYKDILNTPGRLQQEALTQLKRIPAFNNFMQRNSAFSSLFPHAGGHAIPNLAGMQTIQSAGMLVNSRLSGGAEGAMQMVAGQIQQAQNQLTSLLNRTGGNANTLEMPDYRAKSLKSKTFLQRIEMGANVQFVRPQGLLPQTADLALQAAYKFSKKGSAGFGIAYRLGMGSGINKIKFSHEGIGLRSFADFKLKGSLFINGGFEQNYNSSFKQFEELKNNGSWTGSALLGLSKKIKGPKKLTTNIQLFYNFLHRNTVPGSQPILFRTGYNF